MARSCSLPSASGAVMWCASEVIPHPASVPCDRWPRAAAWSARSSTTIPAPSPRTKPRRSASNGRDRVVGSSPSGFARACDWANDAIVTGVTAASVPPVMTTSASPVAMSRAAMAMASAPEAQADTVV